jgi:TonB-dependent starch-binding outer membrane protein SusC
VGVRIAWLSVVLSGISLGTARAQERPPTSYAVLLRGTYLPLESVRDGTVRMPKALARRVVVRRDSVPLQQVLLDIATQAGLGLSYGEDLARSNTIVSLRVDNIPAAEALAAAVRDTRWGVMVTANGQVAVVPASLQLLGAITGRVTDSLTGAPIAGAQLAVEGTRLGVVADDSGWYRIGRIPPGTYSIGVRRIGYSHVATTVTVRPQTDTVHLAMQQSASALDRVVVTGVPVSASRRTLGNGITTLDASEMLKKASNVSVSELLQTKTPGMMVLPGGGTPGAGASMRMRGASSLVAATAPVVYVDGLRIYAGPQGNFWNSFRSQRVKEPSYGAGQAAIALDMLNPDDIESIEIIKGPAAATLYGADAANGVVQVITKRGTPGAPAVHWTAKAQTGYNRWAVDRVTNYTTCTAGVVAATFDNGSARFPGCRGSSSGALLRSRSLDLPGALRDGAVNEVALSARGGGRGFGFFVAADNYDEDGVFYNSGNRRGSARTNLTFNPNDRLDVAVNIGFNKLDTQFPINDDGFGLIQAAMQYRPGYAIDLTQPDARDGFFGGGPSAVYRFDNRLRATRMTLGTTASWRPLPWLRNRLTVGLDKDDRIAEKYLPPGSIWGGELGLAERAAPENSVYTLDYAGTIDHPLPASLSAAFSIGAQYSSNQYRNAIGRGTASPSDQIRGVTPAASTEGLTEYVDQKSLGLYAQEQVRWGERLYVTGALRMDNNSVFGRDIRRLFYPKLAVSYLLSEDGFIQRHVAALDQLKLRAAWGHAGNAPAPFAGARSFSTGVTVDDSGAVVPALQTDSYGNPRIKPERGIEAEAGLDASLAGGRFGVEFTYYERYTRDALMAVAVPPSTGFMGVGLENLGTIANRGIELSLTASPLRRNRLAWDTQLGLSTNRNRLVAFGYDRTPIALSIYQPVQRHQPGYPLGAYWGNFPRRDADGSLIRNAGGGLVADSQVYIGPSSPTREAALGNTLVAFGRVRLYGLLDYKGGHYLYNVKDQYRCWGQPYASAWNRDPSQNVPGSCWEVNDPGRPESEKEIRQQDPAVNNGVFIQRADFVKLRELSLTFTLPPSWTQRLGSERGALTLAAHNVAILWKPHYTGPDPEVNFTGLDDPGGQFAFVRVDAWTAPMIRRMVMALELTF